MSVPRIPIGDSPVYTPFTRRLHDIWVKRFLYSAAQTASETFTFSFTIFSFYCKVSPARNPVARMSKRHCSSSTHRTLIESTEQRRTAAKRPMRRKCEMKWQNSRQHLNRASQVLMRSVWFSGSAMLHLVRTRGELEVHHRANCENISQTGPFDSRKRTTPVYLFFQL